ncbi:MAG: 23S rRNA (adenine(1618)-N(6))-methyltransferase RlmF [Bacteroidia bacterium]|nr:23S rRNA (adenine(1618)-N(6))-methyltransferase RlmF [Bacteroidia bacterium]
MAGKKKTPSPEKEKLHPRNKHRERYDFPALIQTCPELGPFVKVNEYGDQSINFFDPKAVKMLNFALLKHFYGVKYWDIPEGYLCPPIPGRADYIHHLAELLSRDNQGKIPRGKQILGLDIGVGANCIYPILGNKEYHWSFLGSDTDPFALESAQKILEGNPNLKDKVELRQQTNPSQIFKNVLKPGEKIDFCLCNPPFHASAEEAEKASQRKLNNLKQGKTTQVTRNFGGQNSELWCDGGEEKFVQSMIQESRQFAKSCLWFTTLISQQLHLHRTYAALTRAKAAEVITLPMGQGNKISRIVAWTFQSPPERQEWVKQRWAIPRSNQD